MARLEALITMGQRPQHAIFSPVKAPVSHAPPVGLLSQAPSLLSAVPSGQAGPASGPDRVSFTSSTTNVGMTSPLENLYPEPDIDTTEPVFSQPGPVSYGDSCAQALPVSSASYLPPEPAEEGEVSDPEDQPDVEALNLVLIEGYPSKSSEPGGLHVDHFLRLPKSQNRWYGIHPAEPKDPLRPGKSVNKWPNDAAKLNSAFPRICKPAVANLHPQAVPLLRTHYANGRKQPS